MKTNSMQRQRWHVQIPGRRDLVTVVVGEETEKTVVLLRPSPKLGEKLIFGRFRWQDVTFVERDV